MEFIHYNYGNKDCLTRAVSIIAKISYSSSHKLVFKYSNTTHSVFRILKYLEIDRYSTYKLRSSIDVQKLICLSIVKPISFLLLFNTHATGIRNGDISDGLFSLKNIENKPELIINIITNKFLKE